MKKIGLLLVLALACACAKEHREIEPESEGTVLKASLSPLSKTTIDGVKISWTAGDAICVNGQNSAALTEDAAVATFVFENALEAPYKAIYPTSLYKNASTVTLPAVWDPFHVPLYGYLESGDEISFNSLLSIIKLTLTSETATTLSRVVFKPLGGEQVSGDFTINYSTGALTGTSTAEADKSVVVKVNQALGSEAITVYIPVPAGTYASGYYIDLINSEEEIMRCPVAARTLAAGDLRIMPALAFVPNVGPEILGGISNAAEFADFAAAVNAGASTAKWENGDGWVTLLDDIDFTGVTEWTPVGDVTVAWGSSYNPALPDGQHAFTGKFDGAGHHIKNLTMVDAVSETGHHFGLFGYVGKGGIVKNLIIDDNCSLTVTSSANHSAGVIAGVLYDATVQDVTSYAPMTYSGGATGTFHMALIGGIYADEQGCLVDNVHNYGAIEAQNTANLNGGATGLHIAGIAGFTNAGEAAITVSSCKNYGNITSQGGRTAGIVGAANKNTTITGCENHGNQLNTMPKNDGGRLGNICCFTNNGSIVSFCKNYGNLISTTAARVGGIVSLPSEGTYEGNENYGEIISDSQFRGVLYGYLTAEIAWKGGVADGRVGTYNGGEYVYDMYTVADILKYLGKDGSSGNATYTDITINIPTIPAPGGSISDLNAVVDEWNF